MNCMEHLLERGVFRGTDILFVSKASELFNSKNLTKKDIKAVYRALKEHSDRINSSKEGS